MLQQSGNDFVYDLFESLDSARGAGGNTARKKATVSSQFKVRSSLRTCPHPIRSR